MEFNLYSFLEPVKIGSRQNLLAMLASVSDFDNDFTGENGEEFLWDEVDSSKYKSNLDYMLDEVKDIEDDAEAIETFFEEWMNKDGYYDDYEINVLTNERGQVYAFSFVTIHTY